MEQPQRSPLVRYGGAVLSTALAAGVRQLLDPALEDHFPFPLFFAAVVFTAWFAGFGPALLALALGFLSAAFLFLPPRYSLAVQGLEHQLGMVLYLLVGVASVWLIEALRAARGRAEAAASAAHAKQAELEEQGRTAETLYRIGQVLAAELDLQKLVQVVTDEVSRLTRARYGVFFYKARGEQGASTLFYSLSGIPREVFARFRPPRHPVFLETTFPEKSPLRLADVTQQVAGGEDAASRAVPLENLPVRGYLAVPVVARSGEILGGLFLGHPDAGVFGERDERLAAGVAAQAAAALDNAQLYQEARRLADQLQRQNAGLAAAARQKDEFLAMLAHELRNPLAPVRNGLYVLKQADSGEQAGPVLAMIERQVGNLSRMVDDLLDVSRITRGQIDLRKETVELAAVVSRAVEAARPFMEERRHCLTISLPGRPVRLEADPTRLEQVLANLLNNAAKYTEPGGQITLTAEVAPSLPRPPSPTRGEGGEDFSPLPPVGEGSGVRGSDVLLRVRDSGIGISAALLPHVFDLFVQSHRALDRALGGLGIGLTLVRRLVEMHNGRVEVHSAGQGKGSEFVVRLPVLPEESLPDAPEKAEPEGLGRVVPRRVLVVDDNQDSAESMALLLGLKGHEACTAQDGPAALAAACAFRPEVVLLDIGLPGMDGFEVARRLRQLPETREALLVALTGYGQEEDRRRSREAGFNVHLVKPADPDTLQALLAGGSMTWSAS